jgi:tight adherence protein C
MLIIFFLLTTTFFSLFIAVRIFEPRARVEKRIRKFVNNNNTAIKDSEESAKSNNNSVVLLKERFKSLIGSKLSSKAEENLDRKLLKAGYPFGMSVLDFQMVKIVLDIVLASLFILYGKILNLEIIGIAALGIVGLTIAIIFPDIYLKSKIKQRYKQGLKELPDFLDLLTVCLEAGLGFDGALNKVISKRNGVLASEFQICIEEIRLGKTRKEALSGIKERLDFDEMKSLVNSILQAEKLGISIVQILRIKSQEEREKRKQRAEEEAMKAPIKILFPLVLFIFPSIFIVLLGPAIIRLISELGKQ